MREREDTEAPGNSAPGDVGLEIVDATHSCVVHKFTNTCCESRSATAGQVSSSINTLTQYITHEITAKIVV